MSDDKIQTSATRAARAAGKERRIQLPRADLATLPDRPSGFDPVSILESQALDRRAELVPLRYQRMAADEFAFLRGAAATMAYDLALAPNTGIDAQLCGDAHLVNFGIFLSPERRLTFDVNDFDETLPGPFEWDVKRLGASIAVAMLSHGHSEAAAASAVMKTAATYRATVTELDSQGNLEVWYRFLDIEALLPQLREAFKDEHGSPVDALVAKAQKKDSRRAFAKLTGFVDGRLTFIPDPPVVVPLAALLQRDDSPNLSADDAIKLIIDGYTESLPADRAYLLSTFDAVDMARKVVGVGSVGTRCFIVLMLGASIEDPLILQIKEALPSVLESHLGPSHCATAGERVVQGQQLMQTTPDIFLGHKRLAYSETESHDFYVRQLYDGKASVDTEKFHDEVQYGRYGELCGATLARAHARSGRRAEIAAYLGSGKAFEKAIATWSMAYVERSRADYRALLAAIDSGRVSTQVPDMPGVTSPLPSL